MTLSIVRSIGIIMVFIATLQVSAETVAGDEIYETSLVDELINSPTGLITDRVREDYTFFGLASYYNNVKYFIVDKDSLTKLEDGNTYLLGDSQWLAVVGRLDVLLIRARGLSLKVSDPGLTIDNPAVAGENGSIVKIVSKPELRTVAPELDQIRYEHLGFLLGNLARFLEFSIVTIQQKIISNWGMAIVVFAVLLKLILLPVSIMTVRFQRKVSQVQARLLPKLKEIKSKYKAEEAHNRIIAAHRELGVSPFYTLKPMLGALIQVPVLVALFNALGEMPQLDGQSFLWMENLAYPDVIGQLPFSLPMFGNKVSLLPFIMTIVTLFSTVIYRNPHAPESEIRSQKRNLHLMAAAFFILFYPFPAAMVLYWALANILQTVQQQIIKI